MKILHCTTDLDLGGAQIMLYRFLRALGADARRHEVLSLMPGGRISAEVEALGVRVHEAGMARGEKSLRGLAAVRRIIGQVRPDLTHGWMYHGNIAASLGSAARAGAGPVVWGVHHSLHDLASESRSTRLLLRGSVPLSRRVAGIVYCSRVSREQHAEIGFRARREWTVPNGTDLGEFAPDPGARARLAALAGIPEGRIILGNFARAHPMKDHAALAKATALLLEAGHDVHTVIVGAGQADGPGIAAARELGIGDRVTAFDGRSDVAALVPGLDAFVLSSAWGEAFPLAVGEAMAAGVPPVVTDVGDCAWLVGDAGMVARPGDPADLARAVARLLALPQPERRALGMRARARVAAEFSIERYVEAHLEIYGEIVGARRAA